MSRGIAHTPRTARALKKADRIPADLTTTKNKRGARTVSRSVSGGSGETYDGPFKVAQDPDNVNKVLIKGFVASGDDARLIHNYVIAGLIRIENTGDTNIATTSNGIIYAHIENDSGIVVEYLFATTLPAQTNGNVYKTLANIDFADGAVTEITQIQHGEIEVAGRIV